MHNGAINNFESPLYTRWLDKLGDVSGNSFIRYRHTSGLSITDLEAIPHVEIGIHYRGNSKFQGLDRALVEVLSNLVPSDKVDHVIPWQLCSPLASALDYFRPMMVENCGAGPQVLHDLTQKIASGLRSSATKGNRATLRLTA